jgi:alpha-1,3/alpha-1,6-mannosyltransferase
MRWHPDLVFCDLAPHLVPLLRLGRAPVLFYGHFPDLLLTAERRRWYRWYRFPLDRLEEWGTGLADRVVVNSRFTAAAFSRAFPGLPASGPEVLHPGVPLPTAVAAIPEGAFDPIVLLSISRFDPKKNLSLAVEALAALRTRLEPCLFARTRLVLAGGLDRRLREQRDEFDRLTALAEARGLAAQVEFRPSVDDGERLGLLASSRAVLYTPEREHFGMVPLEAMAAGRPVVAIRSGGPCETIVDGRTGFLCDATADSFAEALAVLVADGTVARRMGCDAREHVAARFSLSVFARQLDGIVREMTGN